MIVRVAHIPYLNMVPFHHGFGPEPIEVEGRLIEFRSISPRVLGIEAQKGTIDAGALSLVDWFQSSLQYEPLGSFGIGVKRAAQSVLLFSNRSIAHLQGFCAVTDETSTSFRLLQLLLEMRYGRTGVHYGRIASSAMYDGGAESLLLIGDEALKAQKEGIRGLPVVTDLGQEWFDWQGVPFVFALWAVRHALRQEVKDLIEHYVQKSLKINDLNKNVLARNEALSRPMQASEIVRYWDGFAYELTPDHKRSIEIFSKLLEKTPAVRSSEGRTAMPMAIATIDGLER